MNDALTSLSRLKIVIVDDETAMRTLLKDFFTSQGFGARSFSSPREALRYLRGSAGALASDGSSNHVLVLSDVCMHPMNGMDFLQVLRRDHPTIPVLLFTGAGGPDEKAQALKLGAVHYLTKPFSLGELKGLVETLARRALAIEARQKGQE